MKKTDLVFIAVKPPLDYFALVLASVVAYIIRYNREIQDIRPVIFDLPFSNYLSLVFVVSAISVGIFALIGLYGGRGIKKWQDEIGRVFVGCLAGLAVVLAVMVFSRFLFDSRFIILTSWVLSIIFVSLNRLALRLLKRFFYKFGFGVNRVVLIGEGEIAQLIEQQYGDYPSYGYRIVAKFDKWSGEVETELQRLVDDDKVDGIINVNPNRNEENVINLIDFANYHHLDFRYTADLLGTKLTNIEVTTIVGTPVIEVKKTRLEGWGKIYKRIFDIVASILLIIILSPVMLIVALAIKLTSRGPIFFKYKRIGQFGKPFTYFKFRSMVANAHQFRYDETFVKNQENIRAGTPMMKFKSDPRITPLGKIIRRFSIDELPELFLVLMGYMSLVGPRPHEVEEVKAYQKHHRKLLTIKPGITGMAQVSGRSDLDFEKEVKLDTFYIENWSLSLDVTILLKTPLAIIRKREAI
jgi:exopolysaccharide biosynthesis polyprenyl glycosylphosphotransferase